MNRSKKYDSKISLFIAGFYCLYSCNQVIALIFSDTQIYSIWRIVYEIIFLALLCNALLPIINRIGLILILVEIIFAGMYFVSFFFYENVSFELWKSITVTFLLVYAPLGMGAYCVVDKKILFATLYKMAFVTQALLIVSLLVVGSRERETYSMTSGYALLLQMMIICGHWLLTKRSLDIFFIIVDFFSILFFGSRGPILCFAVFVVLNLLFSKAITLKKKMLILLCIVIVGSLFVGFYSDIVMAIALAIEQFGFSSRTLRLMLDGIATYDSGRHILLEQYIDLIKQKPWLGWGAIGGRKYNVYPHNIYIELLLCFGIPVGALVGLVITVVLIKGINQKEKYTQMLSMIYVAKTVALLLSSSIFQSSDFLICIALCLTGRWYVKENAKNIGELNYYENTDNIFFTTSCIFEDK